jgi:hypothetical protein
MDAIRKLNEYMHCISSEHATLRRQGSAFGRLQQITGPTSSKRDITDTLPSLPPRLQEDSKWSSSIQAMNDTAPSQSPSRCRMSVGSSNVAVKEESNVSEAHRRGSAFGRLQQDSEWSSSTQAINNTVPSQPPSHRRMSVGSSCAALKDRQKEPADPRLDFLNFITRTIMFRQTHRLKTRLRSIRGFISKLAILENIISSLDIS